MTTTDHIKEIVRKTFDVLQYVYDKSQRKNEPKMEKIPTRIIFPKYSDGTPRLSEQELRCLFIEQLNKYRESKHLPWFYSVETPTTNKYNFSDESNLIVVPNNSKDKKVESARIDLVIHDENEKPIALIEFKALNPGEFCFKKDFFKLKHESQDTQCPTFFVMFVENHTNKTINSLHKKIKTKDTNTEFYCYSFNEEEHRIEARIEESQPADQTQQPNV